MPVFDAKQLVKTVAGLTKSLNARNRDVISRRFGLKTGSKETLESIGKGYGITRERVRQIEEFSIAQLTKTVAGDRDLAKYTDAARELIARDGGVISESALFTAVSGNDRESAANASLVFALTLDRNLVRVADNDQFRAFWATDRTTLDAFKAQVAELVASLQTHGAVMASAELPAFAKIPERTLATLMSISKQVGRNIFGEAGLAHWSQIRPKGVRDKAYLVIKKSGNPQHFSEIARLINVAKFDAKRVNLQTVHNELIKDKRFVLVGRGMYALAEWGYKAGTVKDVLVDILKNHAKPLLRSELIAKVKDVRLVKENTILLNLQDGGTFSRTADGQYHLRKK